MIISHLTSQVDPSQVTRLAGAFHRDPPQKDKLHYIFGYGSLIEMESRVWTCPTAKYAFPAVLDGYRRGWNDRGTRPGFNTTFLGAERNSDFQCTGAIFAVSALEFEEFISRETGYDVQNVAPSQIRLLSGGEVNPDAEYFIFINRSYQDSDPDYPIVQSYLDVCLTGCLEFEGMYPLAKRDSFARSFVETIYDWTEYWLNDRTHPRRPTQQVPFANEIDNLLSDVVPEYFTKIRLE